MVEMGCTLVFVARVYKWLLRRIRSSCSKRGLLRPEDIVNLSFTRVLRSNVLVSIFVMCLGRKDMCDGGADSIAVFGGMHIVMIARISAAVSSNGVVSILISLMSRSISGEDYVCIAVCGR